MEGNVEKDTKKTHLNITLEATMLDIKVANLNLFSSVYTLEENEIVMKVILLTAIEHLRKEHITSKSGEKKK